MAYIDADKLITFANIHKNKMIDANDIARFPTADVVQKSEVEKWKEINEQLYKEMSERILEERKIERKLVTNQIFEEIQKIFVHRILHNESQYFEGVLDNITKDLDDLKKKYTKEGE